MTNSKRDIFPSRLYLLDLLRGLASLSVVVWHYQHFFYISPGIFPVTYDPTSQPFYGALSFLYKNGGLAVYLFFALSGFVFFYLYLESIKSGLVSKKEFFILRFSRLYPLHLVTLILIAGEQFVSRSVDGNYIIYPCNDIKHFILNVFLASYWMPLGKNCFSFNEPIWSVSMEIFLYIVFFLFAVIVAKCQRLFFALTILMAIGLIARQFSLFHTVGLALVCFFSGGMAYQIWKLILLRNYPLKPIAYLLALVFFLQVIFGIFVHSITVTIQCMFTYPCAILLLATFQSMSPNLGRRFRIIGDITYATYLLHIPIQIALIYFVHSGALTIDFSTRTTWLVFFTLLIAVSIPTYYWFELPAQRAIRKIFIGSHLSPTKRHFRKV